MCRKNVTHGATVALASCMLASMTTSVEANTGKCERKRVTNIHYFCVNPGAVCGEGCTCQEVTGGSIVKWKDCKCKKAAKRALGESVSISGRWLATVTEGMIAPDSTATLELTPDPGNELTVYEDILVTEDEPCPLLADPPDPEENPLCDVVAEADSQFLVGLDGFTGTIQLTFGSGPPEDIPVQMTALSLDLGSFDAFNMEIPVSTVVLDPAWPPSIGSFDSTTGVIGLGPDLINMLFAALTVQGELRASFGPAGGGQSTSAGEVLELLIDLHVALPQQAIPAVSGPWLAALAIVVLVAGIVVLRRTRTA